MQPGSEASIPYLASDSALLHFVTAWERCELPSSAWTHAAHVATAAHYAFDRSSDQCFELMKAGLLRFNASHGVPNTPDRGYHETLTRFWSEFIAGFVAEHRLSNPNCSRIDAVRAAIAKFGNDRDRWRCYYSFDALRSQDARRKWIAPDLIPPSPRAQTAP